MKCYGKQNSLNDPIPTYTVSITSSAYLYCTDEMYRWNMLVLREKAITTIRSLVIPELCWLRHLFFIELIVFPVKKKDCQDKEVIGGSLSTLLSGFKGSLVYL